jgi:hypothetical protein
LIVLDLSRSRTRAHSCKLQRHRLSIMNEFPSDSHNQPGKKRRATEVLVPGSSKVHSCFNAASSSKHNTNVPQTPPPSTAKRAGTDENTPPRPPRNVPTHADHQTARTIFGAWEKSPSSDAILTGAEDAEELPAVVEDKKVRPQHISRTPCCV